MARYDYRCSHCQRVFEVEHGMNETPQVVCPACGHEAHRMFEASGISLKGSGFYNTDSKASPSQEKSTSKQAPATASAGDTSNEPPRSPNAKKQKSSPASHDSSQTSSNDAKGSGTPHAPKSSA